MEQYEALRLEVIEIIEGSIPQMSGENGNRQNW